jgi:hypothetical protein
MILWKIYEKKCNNKLMIHNIILGQIHEIYDLDEAALFLLMLRYCLQPDALADFLSVQKGHNL